MRIDRNFRLSFAWSNVSFLSSYKPVCRQFFTDRFGQFHNLSFGIDQRIPQRVETKVTGNGQRHRYLRGSDVSKSVGISIGTFGKITVKRGDDGIFAFGVISMALPL